MPTAVSEGTFVDVFDIGTSIRRNKINNLLYSMLNMGKSPKIDKPPNFRNVLVAFKNCRVLPLSSR